MHPSVQGVYRWFEYAHLPAGLPRKTSMECKELADHMVVTLPSGAELTAGLRKLLEAKDCFVRAAIAAEENTAA